MPLRDVHGFFGVRFIHHETGLGEKASFVATLDGFVDFVAATEVVAGDDERFQFSIFDSGFFSRSKRVAPFLAMHVTMPHLPSPQFHTRHEQRSCRFRIGGLLIAPVV